MLIVFSAFKVKTATRRSFQVLPKDTDVVTSVDIPITQKDKIPPVPVKPRVPIEVPDEQAIEENIDDIDILWEPPESLQPGELNMYPDDKTEEEIFLIVEEEPRIIGGMESIYKKLKYPEQARIAGIEGTVIIQFIVAKNGHIRNAKVVRGIGGGCDQEALRAVKKLRFHPGRQRGEAVDVRMNIPVIFRLK